MLSVVDLDPGRANYYLSRGKYEYLQGEGAELVWYGRGASALGLVGMVREGDYRNLFQGFLRGKKLVQNAGKDNHIAGKDLCFSAPKSVSSVWAVSDAKTRAIIESSQLRAVLKALDYLQENATVVRTGKGGKERERAGLIAALAMHGTSRADPPEPQLHTHATLFAVGVTPDGKTRSTVQELPFLFKMSGGAYYRCELARLLEKEAGYRIYRPVEMVGAREEKKSTFEIVDVPDSLIDHWSSRSKEDIANALAEKGLRGAEGKAIAALATRKAKKGTPM